MENNFLKIKNYFFVFGLVVSIVIGLTPFISLTVQEKRIPTVVPEVVNDSFFYYARTAEVAEGHPLIGNPYFYEDSSEIAPAFFVTDWFAAIPLFLNLPTNWAIFFDVTLWVGIFYAIGYLLFRQFGHKPLWSSVASTLVTLAVAWLLIRPVSMQIVFPFFLLSLLIFYNWMAEISSRRKQIYFALAAGASFYLYSYTAQLMVIVYFLLLVWELYKRRLNSAKAVCFAGGMSFLFALPSFYILYLQISNKYFWESMFRTGLVLTHSIGSESILCLGVVFLGILLAYYSFRNDDPQRNFFVVLGVALAVLSVSNIFTGKDLETATHVIRLIDLWFLILFFSVLPNLYHLYCTGIKVDSLRKGLFVLTIILCLLRVFSLYNDAKNYFVSFVEVAPVKNLSPLVSFLQTTVPKDAVIMAPDMISGYIPVYTSGYVLFHPNGGLQLVSDSEMFERYSLSRIGTITEQKLVDDMRLYKGVGPSEHAWRVENRLTSYCFVFKKILSSVSCGSIMNRETYYGDKYFNNLYKVYTSNIEPNTSSLLSKYHVQYVILDNTNSQFILPKGILKKIIYQDSQFTVYSL